MFYFSSKSTNNKVIDQPILTKTAFSQKFTMFKDSYLGQKLFKFKVSDHF